MVLILLLSLLVKDKIDRLREKLNAVIENAQDIMLEAQNEQVDALH